MTNENNPTAAQLRDDIDSGRTGSKLSAPDPAASPLGTDDEAAGTTPSVERVRMAREAEKKIGKAAKGAIMTDDDDDKAVLPSDSELDNSKPILPKSREPKPQPPTSKEEQGEKDPSKQPS